jgi:glutamate formiminotransferase
VSEEKFVPVYDPIGDKIIDFVPQDRLVEVVEYYWSIMTGQAHNHMMAKVVEELERRMQGQGEVQVVNCG